MDVQTEKISSCLRRCQWKRYVLCVDIQLNELGLIHMANRIQQ